MAEEKVNKKDKGMHPWIILLIMLVLAIIAGYLIPSGIYDRVVLADGRTAVDPNTFRFVTENNLTLTNIMTAIPRGIRESIDVIIITFMIGGAFGIIKKTGMLNLGVTSLVKMFKNNKLGIIFVLSAVFVVITGFIGVPELALIYIPVLMPLLLALGFDSMVTVAISLTATAAGFSAAWSAPATVGLGHLLADLPLYSGMGFRVITAGILMLISCIYIAIYAKKILKDPQASLVYEEDLETKKEFAEKMAAAEETYPRVRLAGVVAILLFIGLVIGVVTLSWSFSEMAGYFILLGVIPGIVAGMRLNDLLDSFVSGLNEMLVGAFVIGIARSIAVVLTDAMVMDTIIMYLAKFVVVLPSQLASIGILAVTTLFNGVIASGSGKAVIALPIILPLADITDVTRQTTILAYQLGDGITNVLWPASGYFMAALAIGGVSYKKWVKWALPLISIGLVTASIIVVVASYLQYGPF
ncbi:YfcC family protein [Jeotgalibaca sp. A122]|uniref:YfcC family protein n=1 Tax=Jeotgalibaca sp. A122 TaxID=3457322 RepID=UPI003FD08FC8